MRDIRDLLSLNERFKRNPGETHGDYMPLINGLFLFKNQFAYVMDYALGEIKAHIGFDSVLGYEPARINLLFFYRELFHPDDREEMNEIIYRAIEWGSTISTIPFEILYSIDYRVRKSDGTFIRVLRQTTIIETDEKGAMISTLSVCTDISHLKMDGKIVGRVEGPDAQAAQFEDVVNRPRTKNKITLSAREIEIILLIATGKTSAQIGDALNISVNTVNTHRRNMLDRTGYRNIAQLIMESVKQKII